MRQATVDMNSKQSGYYGAGSCHAVEFTSCWLCRQHSVILFPVLDLTLSSTVDCTATCKQLIESYQGPSFLSLLNYIEHKQFMNICLRTKFL